MTRRAFRAVKRRPPSLPAALNKLQADLRQVTAGVHALINAVRKGVRKGRGAGTASKTKPSARPGLKAGRR